MSLTSPRICEAGFCGEIHEVSCNCRLDSDITELAPYTEEESILFPERANIRFIPLDVAFESLLVCIRDFRERRKEEEDDKETDKASHSKVGPLDVFQSLRGVDGVGEEDPRCEQWCHECANALNGLC